MPNIIHHDKVTLFELPDFHFLVKSFLLLNLHDLNGMAGSQLQFVQLIKLQQSMALGFIQKKFHRCGRA
jgi:hypothetical protein